MKEETAIFIAHEDHVHRDIAESEKNLMRAILRTAMDDLRKRGEVHRDARRYFLGTEDFYLYSFRSVCHHLQLCPKTVLTIVGLREDKLGRKKALQGKGKELEILEADLPLGEDELGNEELGEEEIGAES